MLPQHQIITGKSSSECF